MGSDIFHAYKISVKVGNKWEPVDNVIYRPAEKAPKIKRKIFKKNMRLKGTFKMINCDLSGIWQLLRPGVRFLRYEQ